MLMGALLLIITGRAWRIERAVEERTSALRHQVTERQRTEEALRRGIRAVVPTAADLTQAEHEPAEPEGREDD